MTERNLTIAEIMLIAGTRVALGAGIDALSFLAIPMGDMLMFSIFVAFAFFWRRNRLHQHHRCGRGPRARRSALGSAGVLRAGVHILPDRGDL